MSLEQPLSLDNAGVVKRYASAYQIKRSMTKMTLRLLYCVIKIK